MILLGLAAIFAVLQGPQEVEFPGDWTLTRDETGCSLIRPYGSGALLYVGYDKSKEDVSIAIVDKAFDSIEKDKIFNNSVIFISSGGVQKILGEYPLTEMDTEAGRKGAIFTAKSGAVLSALASSATLELPHYVSVNLDQSAKPIQSLKDCATDFQNTHPANQPAKGEVASPGQAN